MSWDMISAYSVCDGGDKNSKYPEEETQGYKFPSGDCSQCRCTKAHSGQDQQNDDQHFHTFIVSPLILASNTCTQGWVVLLLLIAGE